MNREIDVPSNDRITRQSKLDSARIVGTRFVRLRALSDWTDADQVSQTQPFSGHSRPRNVFRNTVHAIDSSERAIRSSRAMNGVTATNSPSMAGRASGGCYELSGCSLLVSSPALASRSLNSTTNKIDSATDNTAGIAQIIFQLCTTAPSDPVPA